MSSGEFFNLEYFIDDEVFNDLLVLSDEGIIDGKSLLLILSDKKHVEIYLNQYGNNLDLEYVLMKEKAWLFKMDIDKLEFLLNFVIEKEWEKENLIAKLLSIDEKCSPELLTLACVAIKKYNLDERNVFKHINPMIFMDNQELLQEKDVNFSSLLPFVMKGKDSFFALDRLFSKDDSNIDEKLANNLNVLLKFLENECNKNIDREKVIKETFLSGLIGIVELFSMIDKGILDKKILNETNPKREEVYLFNLYPNKEDWIKKVINLDIDTSVSDRKGFTIFTVNDKMAKYALRHLPKSEIYKTGTNGVSLFENFITNKDNKIINKEKLDIIYKCISDNHALDKTRKNETFLFLLTNKFPLTILGLIENNVIDISNNEIRNEISNAFEKNDSISHLLLKNQLVRMDKKLLLNEIKTPDVVVKNKIRI